MKFIGTRMVFFGGTLLLFCLGLSAKEQSKAASILVAVKDESGAVVPNAHIQIHPSPSNLGENLTTTQDGTLLVELSPGDYDLTVDVHGFRKFAKRIEAESDTHQTIEIVLRVQACPPGDCLLVTEAPASSLNQTKQTTESVRTQRATEVPDLSGVWMRDAPPATGTQYWVMKFNLEEPPMTAWGLEQFKTRKSSFGDHPYGIEETNDPVLRGCYPPGVPRVYLHPFPFQFVQAPDEVVMLFEVDSLRRQIYTDGRGHDTALVPLWMGDSIGHWEGDTLVADTVNFNDKTWIDRIGHPHSDQLRVVERFRRTAHDHLVDDITIEDAKAYTKPWTTRLEFKLQPTWRLTEQFCEDYSSFESLEQKETAPAK